MGGALATLYTQRYSERIISLTAICPAGLVNSFPLSLIKQPCMQGVLRSILSNPEGNEKVWRESFYNHNADTHDLEEEMVHNTKMMYDNNAEATNAMFRSVVDFPLYGLANEVTRVGQSGIPILVMWGDKDLIVPFKPSCRRWLNALKQGGKSDVLAKVYSNVSHGLLSEIHATVSKDLAQFLDDHKNII